MAKATAICKCEICGQEFEKTATRNNRREADSWKAWAKENITVCPSCWGKKKRQEEKDTGLTAKVMLGSPYGAEDSLWIVLFGDTYPIKDNLKALGAIWTDAYPETDKAMGILLGGLGMSRPLNRWALCLKDLDVLPEKADALVSMGFKVEFPSEDSVATYRIVRADVEKHRANEQAAKDAADAQRKQEQQQALDALGPKPSYSEEIHAFFSKGKKWNRKFYGKPGKYRIYISGEEVYITDEQKEEMEQTLAARDAWEEKRQAILDQTTQSPSLLS